MMHLDVNETAFFSRELEHIKSKSYDTKQKSLKATSLIPVSTDADAGASKITYRRYTNVGLANIIAHYADNAPRVDVYGEEFTTNIFRIGNGFGYDRDEIRASAMAGKSLDQRKAMAAKRASDEKINQMAWLGDSDAGVQGLINYPGIPEYTVVNGTAGTPQWTTKTPDEIIADMTGMVNAIVALTNGVEAPDTLLLPIAQYNLIASTRMTDGNDKTILRFFLDNNPYIKRVEWLAELAGAGAGASDRMICYVNDPNNLTLEIPMPYSILPPEQRGYGFEILTETKCAGVIVYYPLSVSFGDTI